MLNISKGQSKAGQCSGTSFYYCYATQYQRSTRELKTILKAEKPQLTKENWKCDFASVVCYASIKQIKTFQDSHGVIQNKKITSDTVAKSLGRISTADKILFSVSISTYESLVKCPSILIPKHSLGFFLQSLLNHRLNSNHTESVYLLHSFSHKQGCIRKVRTLFNWQN